MGCKQLRQDGGLCLMVPGGSSWVLLGGHTEVWAGGRMGPGPVPIRSIRHLVKGPASEPTRHSPAELLLRLPIGFLSASTAAQALWVFFMPRLEEQCPREA
ncbi:hypothetical protein VZT92_016139 [Zoarces viviparus]|uniref:Uncharacterized protein n=1 Tax=Zoarces viviparus TaxID=48416 RepID=A0AAW1ETA5_ZOAVI